MDHDARVELPVVGEEGWSDPVLVFTDYGEMMVAQWDAHKKEWFGEGQSFNTGVLFWRDIPLPTGWKISDVYYEVAE